MTTSNTYSDDFRPLDLNELEAVSGARPGDCNGGKVTTIKLPGGTLDMGYEVCEGVGVSTPWAVWTPNPKK
jgi:hypothetical protein